MLYPAELRGLACVMHFLSPVLNRFERRSRGRLRGQVRARDGMGLGLRKAPSVGAPVMRSMGYARGLVSNIRDLTPQYPSLPFQR